MKHIFNNLSLNKVLLKNISTLIVLLNATLICSAQITSPTTNFNEPTEYPSGITNDIIFYFSDLSTAQLSSLSGDIGDTYNWWSYNTASGKFDINVGISSSITGLTQGGGYKLEVTNGTTTNTYFAWTFAPAITSTPTINVLKDDCFLLEQEVAVTSANLIYYNHKGDNKPITVNYGFTYAWESKPTGPIEGQAKRSALIVAPSDTTTYQCLVGSKFDKILPPFKIENTCNAKAVEAKFSYLIDGNPANEAKKEDSAPMLVRFTNESKGDVFDYEWTFGAGRDYIANPIYTFQTAGKYDVTLKVTNIKSGCESTSAPVTFNVIELVVLAPNVFTPFSSPGKFDEFKVLYRSVKTFNMIIYNRWGRKVYQSSRPEEGWDGRIGGKKAEPGVYFYTITAEGFNAGESKKLEGAVHLIITDN